MELFQDLMEDPSTAVRRMSPFVRSFLADAIEEYPPFLDEYVIPTLCGPDPEGVILGDLHDAIICDGFESAGLGEYSGNLGYLGKSFFKKIGKTLKKVATAPIKLTQKSIKATEKVAKRVGTEVKKIAKKDGDLLIEAAGAIAAPFTFGISSAVASGIVAADVARKKRIAANKAKREAKQQAAQVDQAAAQANAQTGGQLDNFYNQNQGWFQQHGISQSQWSSMTNDQKIAAINAASSQAPTSSSIPSGDASAQGGAPTAGGGYGSGGGGGGGGGDGGGGYSTSTGSQKPVQASMFDSSMIPILAAGAALALIFGKQEKGRRTRRNPRRRRVA
jgi:hypothetical protein